ncbi:MAG: MBL fold metallo-hydrolase [Promethearchaeota archaeon]
MQFPHPCVQKIVDHAKKALDSGKSINLTLEIKNLTLSQRFELFCLVKDLEIINHESFPLEVIIWEKFHDLFRNDYSETSFLFEHFDESLELAKIALISDLFDLEDYRTIIRFLYINLDEYVNSLNKLNLSLLHYLRVQKVGSQVLEIFSHLLRFLGIPLIVSEEVKEYLLEFFPEAEPEINVFFELPISTIQRYPEYIEEVAEQLNYDRTNPVLKDWLDHETLFKLEQTKINQVIKSWKPEISPDSVDDLVTDLKNFLAKNDLSSLPIVFNSFVKPFSSSLKPCEVKSSDLSSKIPQEILQTYVEKLVYPISCHKEDKIRITFLGGAQIGTMGILVSTSQSNVLLDYGMSVANYQIPYWNESLRYLDAILVSHAHLDHVGAIPYLYAQGYNGYVFGSGMTKNLTNFLLQDNLELMKKNTSDIIRNEDHRFKFLSQSAYVYQMLDHYVSIKSGQEYQITPDIVIKSIPAHHIQGSLAFIIECGSRQILFSGDVNLDPSALFGERSLSLPTNADLSIIDGTYYNQTPFDHIKRDELLFNTVREDERVIIPAFSIGRAQEVMTKLDNAGLTKERKVSLLGMATKVARVSGLQTKGYLSDYLVQPFKDEVVITGGGMLSGGYARELVELTKEDSKTTIILCGFLAKNTLGNRLLHRMEPSYKQKIVFTRFSGHSSSKTLSTYLESLQGQKVLVHLGNLTIDPFTSKKIREIITLTHPDIKVPSLGSSLEL